MAKIARKKRIEGEEYALEETLIKLWGSLNQSKTLVMWGRKMQSSALALVAIAAVVCFLSLGPYLLAESSVSSATFQALRCGTCHKPDKKASGPTLQEIARVYAGQQEQLVRYLMGEAVPLIDAGKRKTMERQLSKTRELSDEERKNLANYIFGFR